MENRLQDDTAETLFYSANQFMAEGRLDVAEEAYCKALQLAPDLAEIHANLAWLRARQGRLAEAELDYRQALRLAPSNVQISLNFAVMLATQKRFDEAEQVYRQILALDQHCIFALCNLGVLLTDMQRENEAETCFRQALALAPGYAKAAFNLACLLLLQGRYEEGWRMLEARGDLEIQEDFFARQHHIPRWQGEDLYGRRIIIVFESGHGDMIQFIRYARLIRQSGAARLSCLCQPALQNLFADMPELDDVLALNDATAINAHVSNLDYWVPLLSLPGLFHTRLDTIPHQLPYLRASEHKRQRWADMFAGAGGELKVGLVWKGNPQFQNDAGRSIHTLQTLQPLADIPGVQFFSLQKGAGEADLTSPAMPLRFTKFSAEIADFADTAAIITLLDLVVTVDTAVAHLAGALGKQCWVLLPAHQQDWRWLKQREDSPWYPDVLRLFRQPAAGDWDSVISQVRTNLIELMKW